MDSWTLRTVQGTNGELGAGMRFKGKVQVSVAAAALLAVLVPAQAPASGDSADCWATSHGTVQRDGVLGADFAPGGGYVAVGAVGAGTASNTTVGDAWILDVDTDGDLRSQTARGGAGNDWAAAIKRTPDGGYIVGGSAVVDDVRYPWLAKLDTDLAVEWEELYSGHPSEGQVYAVKPTADGGYVAAGHGFGRQHDAFVLKTDSQGVPEWSRHVRMERLATDPDSYDEIWDVRQTADGGYVAVGWTSRPSTQLDAFVVKLSPDGGEEWSYTYGTLDNDRGRWIAQTGDGGYIVAAVTIAGTHDAWVLKLGPDGLVEWQRAYGRSTVNDLYHVHPIQGGAAGYVLSGSTTNGDRGKDGWVFRLDAAGEPVWGWGYGGPFDEVLRFVHPEDMSDPSTGFISAGWTSSYGAGGTDAWTLRLPPNGELAPVSEEDFTAWDATPLTREPLAHTLPGPAVGPANKQPVEGATLSEVSVLPASDRQARCP